MFIPLFMFIFENYPEVVYCGEKNTYYNSNKGAQKADNASNTTVVEEQEQKKRTTKINIECKYIFVKVKANSKTTGEVANFKRIKSREFH